MEMTGVWGGFYRLSLWVTRFAWLNILWLSFTLLGLIFFGLMPATIAMFTVTRKWVQKEVDIPIFQTFFKAFKSNFIRSNLFGIVIFIFGYILSINLKYTGLMNESNLYPLLLGLFVIAAFLYVMLILYIGPVFVHFELSFWQYIKYAIMIGVTNLHFSICALTLLAGVYFISFTYPGLIIAFSFSISAYIIMFLANIGFTQLLKKQQQQIESTKEAVAS
ncbi:YesL family protein [Saliterribacillus persicus]|uniref:Putative membrane protein YesL n=1 Tax=Saliterribacillus persicus TaxID=930114 RepID=A0A368Y967_9BACI|nr:YesL family protein [Saliterribacillus persicus]RCW76742.1 putative membrane protein YesL [Saliterribacillus persicus]